MPYLYDVFISYRRTKFIHTWVDEFLEVFENWLPEEVGGHAPAVFRDKEAIQPGERWPDSLRDALKQSKCLVAIWSPTYFKSSWCLSEWKTFARRGSALVPAKDLVVPIRYHDRETFPPEAQAIQMFDLADCTFVGPGFRNSERYLAFQEKVKAVAGRVATVIKNAPPFDPAWPVLEEQPTDPEPAIPVARL